MTDPYLSYSSRFKSSDNCSILLIQFISEIGITNICKSGQLSTDVIHLIETISEWLRQGKLEAKSYAAVGVKDYGIISADFIKRFNYGNPGAIIQQNSAANRLFILQYDIPIREMPLNFS